LHAPGPSGRASLSRPPRADALGASTPSPVLPTTSAPSSLKPVDVRRLSRRFFQIGVAGGIKIKTSLSSLSPGYTTTGSRITNLRCKLQAGGPNRARSTLARRRSQLARLDAVPL